MAGNSFGTLFRVTTFGESHGRALGTVVDGCPSGVRIDKNEIQTALDRRKPGAAIGGKQNIAATSRNEADCVEILSGIVEGMSTGTPIALIIQNTSQRSTDYDNLKNTFRPGHADFTYAQKYGVRDWRGGGRSSGRETASRVAAGTIAAAFLKTLGVTATAYTIRAAGIACTERDMAVIEQNALRACDGAAAKKMEAKIAELRANGESTGGIVECTVCGVHAGLGEPVFDKLDAELAKAVMSIGAVKGIEFGSGFSAADALGSMNNDMMRAQNGTPVFLSNNAGGILGGISNGNDIVFRAAIKPVPSISKMQKTVCEQSDASESAATHEAAKAQTAGGTAQETADDSALKQARDSAFADSELVIAGRHDVCLCPRIVPVIEAMANIVLADMALRARCARA